MRLIFLRAHSDQVCIWTYTNTYTWRGRSREREREAKEILCSLSYLLYTPHSPLPKGLQDRSSFHSYETHRPNFNGEIEKRQSFISKDNSTLYTVYC